MRPQQQFSRLPAAAMLSVSAVLVIAIGLASYRDGRAREDARIQTQTWRDIYDVTGDLLSLMQDAETGQRGYLLTGRKDYLEPYNSALSKIPAELARLRSLTASQKNETNLVATLQPAIAAKLEELAETIELRRSRGIAPAIERVETDRGKKLMDEIRTRCAYILDASSRQRNEDAAAAEKSAASLVLVATLGGSLLLAFLAASAVTIFRGLTNREKLYQEAYASAELLRVTLSSIGDGVIATDKNARITFINPVAEQLTGWTSQEVLGNSIREVFRVVNETTRAGVENPLEKALALGQVVGLANHTVLLTKDGRETPIDDSGAPIRDAKGDVRGAVLVFRDISARRRAERELQESHQQLEQFVAAASHDLRSPLNSVSSIADLLALVSEDSSAATAWG